MVDSGGIYISGIIPAKNEEKTLPSLIESFLNQEGFDRSNLELIVGIHPTTIDKTNQIALDYGCKVVRGGLPPIGRNNGAAIAKGKILVFKDADSSLPHNNFLKLAIEEMKRRNLDVASPLYYALTSKEGFAKWRLNQYIDFFYNRVAKAKERSSNPIMMNCMFARRAVHEQIGGFDELEFGEDSEYAIKAVRYGNRFGLLFDCGKIGHNMRRFENGEIETLIKNIYFALGVLAGHKFKANSKIRYFE